ncbi:MAG TPA: hypothetical protein PLC98_16125 [Anaerolineales bacterium]|nr:hypothetical protein [Anaerolineales bacterium]
MMLVVGCAPIQAANRPESTQLPSPRVSTRVVSPMPGVTLTVNAVSVANQPAWFGDTPRHSLENLLTIYRLRLGTTSGWVHSVAEYSQNPVYSKGAGSTLSDGTVVPGGARYDTYTLVNDNGTIDREVSTIRSLETGDLLEVKVCQAQVCVSTVSGRSQLEQPMSDREFYTDWDISQYVVDETVWQAQVEADTNSPFKNITLDQTQAIVTSAEGKEILEIRQLQTFDALLFDQDRPKETVETLRVMQFDPDTGSLMKDELSEKFVDDSTAIMNTQEFSVELGVEPPADVETVVKDFAP